MPISSPTHLAASFTTSHISKIVNSPVLKIGHACVDGGDSLRAAVVEVDRSGSGLLSVDALMEVFRLAGVPLTNHQVLNPACET